MASRTTPGSSTSCRISVEPGGRTYTCVVSEDLDDTIVTAARSLPDARGRRGEADVESTVVSVSGGARRGQRTTAPRAPRIATETERHHQFQISSHPEPISLDRPVVVGRRPSSPRVSRGPAPRLLRVPSPLKEVSSSHLEVRQLGSSVIITDLKSTNGTMVMVPGSIPRKLRQGESVVVSPGTLVDIGDDNILQILPTQRLGQFRADEAEAEDTR